MEDKIKVHYNLNFQSVVLEKSFYILKDEIYTYYLVPYERGDADLKDLYETSLELNRKNIACHSFIINRNNQVLTSIDNINYCLMRINFPEEHEFNLMDILNMNKLVVLSESKSNLYHNNWANLWSEKIDYFEYQMSELGSNKKVIINSLSYYIGLAENAIAYVNHTVSNLKDNNQRVVLCRKRVYSPNYGINYLNPLNFIFDLEVRDIAEYIKAAFFNEMDIWSEIDEMYMNRRFTPYEANMFFARLLYPSYYFDIYERIMENEHSEDELIYIVKKVDEYETFLMEIYNYLNNFTPMVPIEWLIKKGLKSPQE